MTPQIHAPAQFRIDFTRPGGLPGAPRDIAAITYAANPIKKGLSQVLGAWRELAAGRRTTPGELVVAGASPQALENAGDLAPHMLPRIFLLLGAIHERRNDLEAARHRSRKAAAPHSAMVRKPTA